MSSLTNGFDKLTVFTTSACLIGAFDRNDCVMEALMNAASGGAVATMTNSRFGWYAPGQNPQTSFSHAFVERYVYRLFSHGSSPGAATDFLLGKADLIGQAASDTTYRWCMYDYNLFGEPALAMANVTGVQDERTAGRRTGMQSMMVRPAVFATSATVEFTLGSRNDVSLAVFDAGGRCVRTLVRNPSPPGRHQVRWDGRTDLREVAPAGVYVITLETEAGRATCKVIRCVGKEQQ
jgi:hypothetical protein